MESGSESYPSSRPDFILLKSKQQKKKTAVNMAIPFGLCCDKCGRRCCKGDKLWAFKQRVGNDPTFDVPVYRFKFSCPCCWADFSIVTDPGQYDYVLESGATLLPSKF